MLVSDSDLSHGGNGKTFRQISRDRKSSELLFLTAYYPSFSRQIKMNFFFEGQKIKMNSKNAIISFWMIYQSVVET